jgi:hypothetical protein
LAGYEVETRVHSSGGGGWQRRATHRTVPIVSPRRCEMVGIQEGDLRPHQHSLQWQVGAQCWCTFHVVIQEHACIIFLGPPTQACRARSVASRLEGHAARYACNDTTNHQDRRKSLLLAAKFRSCLQARSLDCTHPPHAERSSSSFFIFLSLSLSPSLPQDARASPGKEVRIACCASSS